jgi:hypothetical protein
VQDGYKIHRNLTLNLGLRYDVEQNPNERDWNGSNFDLISGQTLTMNQLGTNRIQYTQWKNFGPRVGFDWSPFGGRTIVRGSYSIFYMPITGRATSAFDRFPKDQLYTTQTSDYTAAVKLSTTPAVAYSSNGYGLEHSHDNPNAHVPYFQQVSIDIQRELPGRVLVQAGFTSSGARHLWQNVSYNQIPIERVQAAGGGTQAMRPYPNFSNIGTFEEGQSTSYNALLVQAQRRYANGIMLQGSFTWSKFIDTQDDNFSGLLPQDQYNMKAERGLSLANIPTRLVVAGMYDLPFGKGHTFAQKGPVALVLGGWQLSGIFSIQSGQQVWIRSANNTSGTFSQMMRPNLAGSPVLPKNQRKVSQWFNTSAFSTPAAYHFGNSPKTPNIQGPAWYNLDFNVHRNIPIPITEKTYFELRGECFNCANHANFNPPSDTFGSSSFGHVTSAQSARTIQVSGKLWF